MWIIVTPSVGRREICERVIALAKLRERKGKTITSGRERVGKDKMKLQSFKDSSDGKVGDRKDLAGLFYQVTVAESPN